eukprot:14482956-Alexandrium_andersonii.AAC.1
MCIRDSPPVEVRYFAPNPPRDVAAPAGPDSPNGPRGPLHGSESTQIRAPAFQRWAQVAHLDH